MKHNLIKIKQVACLGTLVVFGFSGMSVRASESSSEEKKVQEIADQESADHGSAKQEAVHWGYSGNTGPAYRGSLTTPPCSENVNWLFMKTPIQVSDQQVRRFAQLVGENARPLQDMNWRKMLVSN